MQRRAGNGLLLAAIALSLGMGACSPAPAPSSSEAADSEPTDVVVIVSGEAIRKLELERALDQLVRAELGSPDSATTTPRSLLRAGLRKKALDDLINRKVQVMEARRRNIAVSQAEIDQLYRKAESAYASPEEYRRVVAELGYSPEELRQGLADDIRINKLKHEWIEANPTQLTEEEIQELYRARRSQFITAEGREIPLEEVKETLRDWMLGYKQQKEYEQWVSELRSAAQVVEMGM